MAVVVCILLTFQGDRLAERARQVVAEHGYGRHPSKVQIRTMDEAIYKEIDERLCFSLQAGRSESVLQKGRSVISVVDACDGINRGEFG